MQNTISHTSKSWKRGAPNNTTTGMQAKAALDKVNEFADSFVATARAKDNTEADLNTTPGVVSTESLEGFVAWDRFNLTHTSENESTQIWRRPTSEGTEIVMNVSSPGQEFTQHTTSTIKLDANGNITQFEQSSLKR